MSTLNGAGIAAAALIAILSLLGLIARGLWRGVRSMSTFLAAVQANTAALGELRTLLTRSEDRLSTTETNLAVLTGRLNTHLEATS